MINIKKIDDKDLIFINKPLSIAEEKAFSEFLKQRKKPKVKPVVKSKNATVTSK